MRQPRKKNPFNYTSGKYITSILFKEFQSVKKMYITNHDPFYGWVVGNIAEENIKLFVIENFERFNNESISPTQSRNNFIEFSLLIDALKMLIEGRTQEEIQPDGSSKMPTKNFPDHPKEFNLEHWGELRFLYEKHKKEQTLSLFDGGYTPGEIDTGLSNGQLVMGKFGEQKKISDLTHRMGEREKESLASVKPDYMKGDGTLPFDEKRYKPEHKVVTVKEKIGKRKILYETGFIALIKAEIDQTIGSFMDPDVITILPTKKEDLIFSLAIIKRGDKGSLLPIFANKLKPEVDDYLNAKYLDVTSQVNFKEVEGVDLNYYSAQFTLDAVIKSENENLYFVRNDNIYLNLD